MAYKYIQIFKDNFLLILICPLQHVKFRDVISSVNEYFNWISCLPEWCVPAEIMSKIVCACKSLGNWRNFSKTELSTLKHAIFFFTFVTSELVNSWMLNSRRTHVCKRYFFFHFECGNWERVTASFSEHSNIRHGCSHFLHHLSNEARYKN